MDEQQQTGCACCFYSRVCGKEQEWKSEAGHCYVQHAISACYGTLFACVYLLERDPVSRVQLAPRPVLNESEDRWSASLKKLT